MSQIHSESFAGRPDHIRVLQIRPGRKTDPICCRFLICSLDSPDIPPYNALSYCWGDTAPSETVFVAGVEAKVTSNLHLALIHLRQRRKAFLLWVDALCINQEDLEEKKVQIEQMRRIYHSANQVIIWLGEGTEQTRYAVDWLKCGPHDKTFGEHPAVWQLTQRPWWSRVWVLQEVAAASKDPVVRCGDDEMSWSDLRQLETPVTVESWASFLLWMRPLDPGKDEEIGRLSYMLAQIQSFLATVRRLRDGGLLTWKEVFLLGLHMRASDKRDLIYGLLGVMNSHGQSSMRADYSLDASHVLRVAAATALGSGTGLEMMTLTTPARDEGLPSWVPDMSRGSLGLFLVPGCKYYRPAGASRPALHWSQDFSTLHTRGFPFDVVSEVAIDDKGRLNQSRALARKLSQEYNRDEEEATEWYWRTMCANQGRYGGGVDAPVSYPAHEEFGLRFRASEGEIEVPESVIGEGIRFEWEMEYFKPWYNSVSAFKDHGQANFFVTESGRFGLGQSGLQKGDVACILSGSWTITILRKHGDYYQFVGCAYIHGLMDGEMASQLEDESKVKTFEIH